ncbi:MAG TPA: hypothetical protein VLW26_02910 [Steroidobacteraceae bacterium]|nr:hypothetical protein [Steroidobacteraceae bacterium]
MQVSALAAALTAAILASACGTMSSLSDEAPSGVSLAGTWKLNPAQSTDSRQALQKLVPHRPSGGRNPDRQVLSTGSPIQGGTAYAYVNETALPVDLSLQRDALRGGDWLQIEQKPTEFRIFDGNTTHTYTPGERSVVSVSTGVADQRSGWSGSEYRVLLVPQIGPRMQQSYRLSSDHKQLVETIEVGSEGHIPALKVTRVYDPTTGPPRSMPLGD